MTTMHEILHITGAPDIALVMKELIVAATGGAAALGVYLAVCFDLPWFAHDVRMRRVPISERLRYLGYAMARVGFAIVVLLVGELVYHAPRVPPTWRADLYLIGLLMGTVGLFIVAWNYRHTGKRSGPLDEQKGRRP